MTDGKQFFAAIPHSLMDDLADRKITMSMLVVMNLLYRWASFQTGMVKRTSAKAIAEAAGMHPRTAQDSLLRLDKQGYIQRHLKLGSHHWYAVSVNNFMANVRHPVKGPDGKPERGDDGHLRFVVKQEIINPSKTFTWDEVRDGSPCGTRAEDVEEPVYGDVDERLCEGIENTTKSEQEEQERPGASQQLPPRPAGQSGGCSQQASNPTSKPKDSDLEFAERIAKNLEPDQKYHGASVQKLLDFLSHADESARTCISDAVSDPFVMKRLNQATDSKMGYLIDSVKRGYVAQWLEKAEKDRDKRRKKSPPAPAAPPDTATAPEEDPGPEGKFKVGTQVEHPATGKTFVVARLTPNGSLALMKEPSDSREIITYHFVGQYADWQPGAPVRPFKPIYLPKGTGICEHCWGAGNNVHYGDENTPCDHCSALGYLECLDLGDAPEPEEDWQKPEAYKGRRGPT